MTENALSVLSASDDEFVSPVYWPLGIQQQAGLTYCIDQAPDSAFYGTEIMLEGWCFAEEGKAKPKIIGVVRIVGVESQHFADSYDYEKVAASVIRQDVQASYPEKSQAKESGFIWKFKVARNATYEISIFAEIVGNFEKKRIPLTRRRVEVIAPRLLTTDYTLPKDPLYPAIEQVWKSIRSADYKIYLDLPQNNQTLHKTFYLYGWCFSLIGQDISEFRAKIGESYFPLKYGLARKDVYRFFKGRSGTLNSGFEGMVECEYLPIAIIFEARVCGRWFPVNTTQITKVSLPLFSSNILRKSLKRRITPILHGKLTDAKFTIKSLKVKCFGNRGLYIQLRSVFLRDLFPKVLKILNPFVYGNFSQYPQRRVEPERFPKPSSLPAESLPKFTIVTPSYNQGIFIRDTIESVLNQKLVMLDYVIMDGGSTDHSPQIISEYDLQLKFWVSQKDGGQSAAIANGFIQAGEGRPDDIMAYLNSDDLLLPGVLRFVAEYFHKHPEVDVVYGHRVIINRDGMDVGKWHTPRHNPTLLRYIDLVPQETLFWRRRLYDKVGGVDASFKFALDWDLLVRFLEAGAVMRRLPYFMGCFRVHEDSKTIQQSTSIGALECDRIRRYLHGRTIPQLDLQRRFQRAQIEGSILGWLWKKGVRW